jgi:pyridoxal phosphate enzyme (YggS family)
MILDNVQKVRERIASACVKTGRDPSEVTLVAVSKTFSADRITEAVRGGLRDIGENYVQELLGKKEEAADKNITWHFIGHLQTNKVKYIAEWIHLIHTVDTVDLARELDKRGAKADRVVDVLVEVNTTGEVTKYGIQPGKAIAFVESLKEFQHIRLGGLMTIGPFLPDPECSRPMFRQLRLLKEEVAQLGQENVVMDHLSMGMTGDYEVAIEEGATILRIGTAIFGSRKNQS